MYSEWASLSSLIQNGNEDSQSVLGKFSTTAGKEVAVAVVRQLATNLGFAQAAEPSPLTTDREVQWCMEVCCILFIGILCAILTLFFFVFISLWLSVTSKSFRCSFE